MTTQEFEIKVLKPILKQRYPYLKGNTQYRIELCDGSQFYLTEFQNRHFQIQMIEAARKYLFNYKDKQQ